MRILYASVIFPSGAEEILIDKLVWLKKTGEWKPVIAYLDDPNRLTEEHVLVVHFADGGAQRDAGAVWILYLTEEGVRILYGNSVYGNLDPDALIRKLHIL